MTRVYICDKTIVNIEDRVWKAGGVAELCYCSLSRDSYSARPVSKCKVST